MPFERVLLVSPPGRRGLSFSLDLIPISLEYIAAFVEDVVEEVSIVDMEREHRSFPRLLDIYQPDLVGITMSATEHNDGLRLAEIAWKRGITCVAGGYHPTSVPDLMLSYPQLGIVVRGEGELTMRELVEKDSLEDILGISYRRDGRIFHNEDRPHIQDLDSLPFPARHLRQYSYKAADRKTDYDVLTTSRGCYGRCSFCCEPSMSGGHLRCRSPENVMEEIVEMVEYHDGRALNVMLTDPNFMGNPKRVERLCDLMQKHELNIKFHALVRPDSMAANPEIVKKMCEVGIAFFEMGIESPNPEDLKTVKKGITTGLHSEAVRNILENGCNACGTFVIGLPSQTENEIKSFPVYAKEIGLTAAAFGIATPFPGTEFYKELDKQELIFETNWKFFDEMHSVYQTRHLTKQRVEELATYCMARFWSIDKFIDNERILQKKTRKKTSLINFIKARSIDVRFMHNSGEDLRKDNFHNHIETFLKAYINPSVEAYTRKIGIHNVLELSRFLRILGNQKIQCTLTIGHTTISFICVTTKKTVEYVRIIRGKHRNSTIDFTFDLNWVSQPDRRTKMGIMKAVVAANLHNWNMRRLLNTCRLLTAVGTEILVCNLKTSRLTWNHHNRRALTCNWFSP